MFGGRQGGKKVNNRRYYELLGVLPTATDEELKKAFRKKSLKMHPDRGGDTDKFQELNLAYDTLKDPQKRAAYDRLGEEGMKAGAGAQDAFGGMFGQDKGPKKTKSIIHPVKCTLEELYNGKSTRIKITRDRICKKCDGKGGESHNNQKC